MGHHYTPQYYLKGFVDSEGHIWVYEKGSGTPFRTGLKNVGHETGFYSAAMEQYLANQIEGPANRVIEKIRARDQISASEKITLVRYMVALMKRVPKSKERIKGLAPQAAPKTLKEFEAEVDGILLPDKTKTDFMQKARVIFEKFAKNPPKEIWLEMIPPHTSPMVVEVISTMTWIFLTNDSGPVFLTNDNPVFFFESLGIGKPDSEITFPISNDISLWATWRKNIQDCIYSAIRPHGIREINRRTASNATRYVFHSTNEKWIPTFINKVHRLNLMKS